jgi:hypothetical protein
MSSVTSRPRPNYKKLLFALLKAKQIRPANMEIADVYHEGYCQTIGGLGACDCKPAVKVAGQTFMYEDYVKEGE